MNGRLAIAVVLGLGIGLACGLTGIPAPAPPVLAGALLVVAMTLGYQGADAWLARREARQRALCGGPDGRHRGARR
jgi:XapX domain-containing protein